MFNLVSIRTPSSFPAKLLSSWLPPSMFCAWIYSIPVLLVELHETPVSPFLQPVMPLDGSMILWFITQSSQFDVIRRCGGGTLCPIIQVINEDVEQDSIQY